MAFGINHLTPVIFGEGISSETGVRLNGLGCKKVLCVYDRGIKEAGITDKILNNMLAQGIKSVIYDGVLADPPDYTIEEAAEIGRQEQVDGIVGIGGGSSMDTAKAVNILLGNPSPINQYMTHGAQPKPGKVLILLPTTSGTAAKSHLCLLLPIPKRREKGV